MLILLIFSIFHLTVQSADIKQYRRALVVEPYPWSAEIIAVKDQYEKVICSAFLLNAFYVGTSTYCTKQSVRFSPSLETTKYRYNVGFGSGGLDVDKICHHPDFCEIGRCRKNDITLLKLKKEVQFSPYIKPIKLPKGDAIKPKMQAISSIYEQFDSNQPPTHKKIVLEILGNKQCASLCFDEKTNLCAKRYRIKNVEHCNGDIGSALAVGFNQEYYIFGVTSYTLGRCDRDAPAVYTRITPYLPWINEILSQEGDEEGDEDGEEPGENSSEQVNEGDDDLENVVLGENSSEQVDESTLD